MSSGLGRNSRASRLGTEESNHAHGLYMDQSRVQHAPCSRFACHDQQLHGHATRLPCSLDSGVSGFQASTKQRIKIYPRQYGLYLLSKLVCAGNRYRLFKMARALDKVQKKIAKKRGGKPTALHENSRDAQRLRTAGAREDKINKLMKAAEHANQQYINRVLWVQEQLEEVDFAPRNDEQLHEFVRGWIARQQEEMETESAAQRPGRPKSKALADIHDQIDSEEREYKIGFWFPDVRDEDSLGRLRQYKGSWGGLNNLTFVRAYSGGDIKPSSFPPKALS